MDVNKKILKYLEDKGINHSVLVKKTGISKQNLSRILSSDDIKYSQLAQITTALDLPLTYFIDGKEKISNEEIEGYKETIADLKEDIADKKEQIKGHKHLILEVAKEVERIRKSKDKTKEINEFLDSIEKWAAILGLIDAFGEAVKNAKGTVGVAQPAELLPEKAQSLLDKKTKSKK